MPSRNLFRLIPLLALLAAGIWLLTRPSAPAPDTVARQQSLRSLLAPAGAPAARAPASPTVYDTPIEPVTVDLADVEPGVYDPHNSYDAVMRGDIDMEHEYRLSAVEVAALQEEALALPADPDVPGFRRSASPDPLSPADDTLVLQLEFDALDVTDCCGNPPAPGQPSATVPPDSHLAAGPDHLLAAVNIAFEIYDKTGTVAHPATTFYAFFNGSLPECVAYPYGAFDPTVLYDEEADRFTLSVDGNGRYFCIAVSASGDPTGTWYQYAIPANLNNSFHDYPHTGVGQDAIFVGANQFFTSTTGEARFWALNKARMYAGQPLGGGDVVTYGTIELGYSGEGSPQPLNLHGYAQYTWPLHATHYFVTDPYDGNTLRLWAWPDPLGGGMPAVVASFNLEAASGVSSGFPVPAPQQGGEDIEANDWRFRGFEYRNGYGWTADTVACNPGGGAVDCVRWVQIDLYSDPPSLVQAAVHATSGAYRTFPDLAANHCDDMAIGYNVLSGSTWPEIRVTGRENADPPNTLQGEIVLKTSETAYFSTVPGDGDDYPYALRWGDYSSMAIDPDGLTFWHIGEYVKGVSGRAANWGNYVGAFAFPGCQVLNPNDLPEHHFLPSVSRSEPAPPEPPPTPEPTPTPTPVPGGNVVIKAENFEGSFPNEWEIEDADPDGGEQMWGKSDCRAQSGSYSGWGVGNGGPGCGDDYPNHVTSWMVYGPFDLGDAEDAALNFAFWSNTVPNSDQLFWGASVNGNNFSGYAVSGAWTSWTAETFSLTDVPSLGDLRGESQVWIAFVFFSNESDNVSEGSFVDNVVLWKTTDGSAIPAGTTLTAGPNRTVRPAHFNRPN